MKIELHLMTPFEDDDEFNQSYDFEIWPFEDFEDDKFKLTIFYNKDKSLKEQVQDRRRLEKKINLLNKTEKKEPKLIIEGEKEKYQQIKDYIDNLYNYVDTLLIEEDIDIENIIKNNPDVLSKKIIMSECFEITEYYKLKELKNKYKDYKNIYVKLEGNDNIVTLENAYKTAEKIKEESDFINSLNLSPIESIMIAYDIVRNRKYKKEKEDEPKYLSRDLSEVLFGENIVSLGFANHFSALLTSLGYINRVVIISSKDSEHARVIASVTDPKYNIDGVYYFDPTLDSKIDDFYINNYAHFARTREYFEKIEQNKYRDNYFPFYCSNFLDKLDEVFTGKNYNDYFSNKEKYMKYINSLNYMFGMQNEFEDFILININKRLKDKNWREKIKNISEKFDKKIPGETLFEIFKNVRKIEYYIDPKNYPYDSFKLYLAILHSNWELEQIKGEPIFEELPEIYMPIFPIIDNNLEKEIEQVTLTKTLRMILEKQTKIKK